MSRENVEIVRRVVAAINRTGAPPLDLLDPEIVFTTRGELQGRARYLGHEGFLLALDHYRQVWEHIESQILEVVEGPGTVVAVGRFRLQGHSGVALEEEEAWAYLVP